MSSGTFPWSVNLNNTPVGESRVSLYRRVKGTSLLVIPFVKPGFLEKCGAREAERCADRRCLSKFVDRRAINYLSCHPRRYTVYKHMVFIVRDSFFPHVEDCESLGRRESTYCSTRLATRPDTALTRARNEYLISDPGNSSAIMILLVISCASSSLYHNLQNRNDLIIQVRLLSAVHGLDITLPLLSSRPILPKEDAEKDAIAASLADATTDDKQSSSRMSSPWTAQDLTNKGEAQQQAAAPSTVGANSPKEQSSGEFSTARGVIVEGATPALYEETEAGEGGSDQADERNSRTNGGWKEHVVPVSAESFFFVCPPLSALVSNLVSYYTKIPVILSLKVYW